MTLLLCAMLLLCLPAAAAETSDIPADYPGLVADPDGNPRLAASVSSWVARECISAFHYAYDAWPRSWQDVRDSGICQKELFSPDGRVIDPDDGSLDFHWDIQFMPVADGKAPRLLIWEKRDGREPEIVEQALNATISLQQTLANMSGESEEYYAPLIADREWRRLEAIKRCCNNLARWQQRLSGQASAVDFLNSEWSPVSTASVNPLTGRRFRFDGSAHDLSVSTTKEGQLRFRHIPADAEIVRELIP
ncbi:MAG: hypothetical protein R3F46_06375 [bacterium]